MTAFKRRQEVSQSFFVKTKLQYFSDKGGDGSPDGGDDPKGGDGRNLDGGNNPPGNNEPPVTYTQEQFTQAQKEAERVARSNLYKELGVTSLNDLKGKVGQTDKVLEEFGVKTIDELKAKVEAANDGKDVNDTLKVENETQKSTITQLQQQIKDMQIERAFFTASQEHSPHDYDLLFSAAKPLFQYDPDSGEIVNMNEVLTKLKTEKAFLFNTSSPEGGGDSNGGGSKKPNDTTPGGGNPPGGMKGKELGAELAKQRNAKFQKK